MFPLIIIISYDDTWKFVHKLLRNRLYFFVRLHNPVNMNQFTYFG